MELFNWIEEGTLSSMDYDLKVSFGQQLVDLIEMNIDVHVECNRLLEKLDDDEEKI